MALRIGLTLLFSMCIVGCASPGAYRSPEEAATALLDALRSEDRERVREVLGPRAEELKSGDPTQDRRDVTKFQRELETRREVRYDSDSTATLLVGEDAWPFSVPLVRRGNSWRFDVDAGLEEIAVRRIGRNELNTIEACLTLLAAQREYISEDRDGDGVLEYAGKLMSTPGRKDGLYWQAGPGGLDASPIGPAFAMAAVQTDEEGERMPFHGYRYKLLARRAGPNGPIEYRNGPDLVRGWAVVAHPDEYGVSGITSFMVSDLGEIWESDLGPDGAALAEEMDTFNPGSGWTRIGD